MKAHPSLTRWSLLVLGVCTFPSGGAAPSPWPDPRLPGPSVEGFEPEPFGEDQQEPPHEEPLAEERPCPGDVDGNMRVDQADLAILLSNFGSGVPVYESGDLDGDGYVGQADLAILLAEYGAACFLIEPEAGPEAGDPELQNPYCFFRLFPVRGRNCLNDHNACISPCPPSTGDCVNRQPVYFILRGCTYKAVTTNKDCQRCGGGDPRYNVLPGQGY